MKISYTLVNLLFACFFFFTSILSAQTGIISGKITDYKTHEPLIGANIILIETENTGAATDAGGRFVIKVPAGSYSLKASMLGYKQIVKTDVIVRTGSEAIILIQLEETSLNIDEVSVTADYFDKSVKENDLSTVVLSAEEVKRSPGSSLDIQRILQGMAGVSFSSDRTNELIVRGGSPDENLVILDGMEIHSINHFPSEYSSGGAINMINVDLVQDIKFSTGGFTAKYGDKLSSIMGITTRDGTRNSVFDGNINLSMAGAGVVLEGMLNNGKGSWLVSARNSFLSLFTGIIGKSGVPVYRDLQFKLKYDLSPKHTIAMSVLYGWDKILEDDDYDNKNADLAGKIDSVKLSGEDIKQHQYTAGISLKSIWRKNIYTDFSVYYTNYHFDITETERLIELQYDNEGKVTVSTGLNKRFILSDNHDNGEAVIKGEIVWSPGKNNELSFGGAFKSPVYKQHILLSEEVKRYDKALNGWNTPDDVRVTDPSTDRIYDIRLFEYNKSYFFINDKLKFINDRLVVNAGLRYDYFSYSGYGILSPRLSASFAIVPQLTYVNFAFGDYYQAQTFPLYLDKYQSGVNKHLENSHARHFVLGLEHILSEGLNVVFESYYKKYSNIPVSEEYIHTGESTFRSEKYINAGKRSVYGFDLLFQQKLVKDLFGTFAFSKMWSKDKDPRIGFEGKEYSSEYEYPNVLTLILGKRFSGLRAEIDKMPVYIKCFNYILPISNDMEISTRWRYADGRAYTPGTFITSEQKLEGGLKWSEGVWKTADEIYSKRFPSYHRLDVAFNSRYNFSAWSLSVYLSIQNIYNRKNILRYKYKSDGTIKDVYQFSIFPVAGLEINF
jgi:outer membrane cobalamin receptor